MAKHRMRRHRRRRSHDRPSTSMVTYQRVIGLSGSSSGTANTTTVVSEQVDGVENTGGETVNRKIVRITGELCFSSALTAGDDIVAMLAMWAHPKLDGFPSVDSFDPFTEGPTGAATYEGRITPRPFGRKYFALNVPASGAIETLSSEFRYHTKAARLLRPGWILSAGLWVRSTKLSKPFSLNGILSAAVAG